MVAPKTASEIVNNFLAPYGLQVLGTWALNVYKNNGGGQVGIDAITAELPQQAAFKVRFPAYETLAKEGRAMSVNEMLSYEQTARQIMHANGIPAGFYDQPSDFAQFMLHDVSVSELETRVKDAQAATIGSPPDVLAQLQTLYGVDQGHLTAFFLDPNVAEPLIAQKFTAAQIAAQSGRANVGQLTAAQAQHLAQLGVTDQSAAAGFQQLGTQKGLFEQQVAGEKAVPLDQQLAAQFEGNTEAQLAFKRRQALRVASFQGQAGFAQTREGVGGLEVASKGV